MNNVMFDLETLSLSHNAVILQIGACYFDDKTGETGITFSQNIDINSCLEAGLEVDGKTVKWWMQQSDEARNNVINNSTTFLAGALQYFNTFLAGTSEDKPENMWSHSANDFTIITNAFKKCYLKPNFHYGSPRDIRTLCAMPGVVLKNDFPQIGISHNALDDCLFQVQYVVDYLNQIRSKK